MDHHIRLPIEPQRLREVRTDVVWQIHRPPAKPANLQIIPRRELPAKRPADKAGGARDKDAGVRSGIDHELAKAYSPSMTNVLQLAQIPDDLAGESVPIAFFHVRHYPADADDTIFLLAALNGRASHLVTYDDHLHDVSHHYPEFVTCLPLAFLAALGA